MKYSGFKKSKFFGLGAIATQIIYADAVQMDMFRFAPENVKNAVVVGSAALAIAKMWRDRQQFQAGQARIEILTEDNKAAESEAKAANLKLQSFEKAVAAAQQREESNNEALRRVEEELENKKAVESERAKATNLTLRRLQETAAAAKKRAESLYADNQHFREEHRGATECVEVLHKQVREAQAQLESLRQPHEARVGELLEQHEMDTMIIGQKQREIDDLELERETLQNQIKILEDTAREGKVLLNIKVQPDKGFGAAAGTSASEDSDSDIARQGALAEERSTEDSDSPTTSSGKIYNPNLSE